MSKATKTEQEAYLSAVKADLLAGVKHNKRSYEKLAKQHGIENPLEAKELTELAIVETARSIAQQNKPAKKRYFELVELYKLQPNLNLRSSTSTLLQQYSTPAPISFIASEFTKCGKDKDCWYFEPSAGNGLLTISWPQEQTIVNEISEQRISNLEKQNYYAVTQADASRPFYQSKWSMALDGAKFDGIATNPPFGRHEKEKFDGYTISKLEHVMAIRALEHLKDTGKAAIIIGGHLEWDEKGRIKAGANRSFYAWLYKHFNVVETINIHGKSLYTRMGTGFPVRLILIDGRAKEPQLPPLKSALPAEQTQEVKTWDELWVRAGRYLAKTDEFPKGINAASTQQIEEKAAEYLLQNKAKQVRENPAIVVKSFFNTKEYADFINSFPEMVNRKKDVKTYQAFVKNKANVSRQRVLELITEKTKKMKIAKAKARALMLLQQQSLSGLGAPYMPTSEACNVLDVVTPDSMAFEVHAKLNAIEKELGMDFTDYVKEKLNYSSRDELCDALAAEQIDGVAVAIYNIEKKNQGLIIGDQTGIGKGRMAAAMVRYGIEQGKMPIFITEKVNLFSDFYRDLIDIGYGHVKPFILNKKDSEGKVTKITIGEDELHRANAKMIDQVLNYFNGPHVPPNINDPLHKNGYDLVMATYSQFNRNKMDGDAMLADKKGFLLKNLSLGNIMILDESHNAGGESNTGAFFKEVAKYTKGIVFLSATFAKRPDNMPLYALKTAMSDAAMTDEDLVQAITAGGVALQEVLSSQLVAEGQMLRRERTYDGIKVQYLLLGPVPEGAPENTLMLTDKKAEHSAIANNITGIVRDIIDFEKNYIDEQISLLDDIASGQMMEVEKTKGTSKAGVDNTPFFSKVFNVVNQMLFSIKAEETANHAIRRLEDGFKPVIAFSSTMESFLDDYKTNEIIRTDFTEVLVRGLKNTLSYTEKDIDGKGTKHYIELSTLAPEAQQAYHAILDKIKEISSGITISPLDLIAQRIEDAGYTVAEVTGRSRRVELDGKGNGQVLPKKKENRSKAFFKFNNNEVDVLLINQTGSTGASAHAHLPKGATISKSEIKPRVMIVQQAELNINTEVQKRGRINRTGQIMPPEFDYITSAIPAEERLMMMLQKKLKSLDANTTSSQKSSKKILDTDDFLNKYGDEVVVDFLWEREELNERLGDPLNFADSKDKPENPPENAAHKVSGRVAVLPVADQKAFYDEIKMAYEKYVKQLHQKGLYDLEVEVMDLDAKTLEKRTLIAGRGGSRFGTSTYEEKCEINNLNKPYTQEELQNLLNESLNGKTPGDIQQELLEQYDNYVEEKKNAEYSRLVEKYKKLFDKITSEKGYKKVADDEEARSAYYSSRKDQIEEAKEKEITSNRRKIDNQASYVKGLFRDLHIGKNLYYPTSTFGEGQSNIPAIFLGFKINEKKPNPFAPSSIDLQFAVANGIKQLDLVASDKDREEINAILGASRNLKSTGLNGLGRFRGKRSYSKKTHLVRVYTYTDDSDEVFVKSDYEPGWINWVKANMQGRRWTGTVWEWPNTEANQEKFGKMTEALKRFYPDDRIELYKDGQMFSVLQEGDKDEPEEETKTDERPEFTTSNYERSLMQKVRDEIEKRDLQLNANGIESAAIEVLSPEEAKTLKALIGRTSTFDFIKHMRENMQPTPQSSSPDFLEQWDELTKESSNDRVIRYIATGNLLQVSGKENGARLIQFTREDKSEDKGLLMPISYNPNKAGSGRNTTVPVHFALKVVKSLQPGSVINLSNSMSIGKSGYENWTLTVPVNKKSIYQNSKLMELSNRGEFFKTGNNFRAEYSDKSLETLLNKLNKEFGITASLTAAQFDTISDLIEDYEPETLPPPPVKEDKAATDKAKKLKVAKAKAKALILLQLQAA